MTRKGIFVAVRDPQLIRAAMGRRSYRAVAASVRVGLGTLHELASGEQSVTSAATASSLERHLEVPAGSLFGLTIADADLVRVYGQSPIRAAS